MQSKSIVLSSMIALGCPLATAAQNPSDPVRAILEAKQSDTNRHDRIVFNLFNESLDPYGYCQARIKLPIRSFDDDGDTMNDVLGTASFNGEISGIPLGQPEYAFEMKDFVPSLKDKDWEFEKELPDQNVDHANFSIQLNCTSMTVRGWCGRYAKNANSLESHSQSVRQLLYAYNLISSPTAMWKDTDCDRDDFNKKLSITRSLTLNNKKVPTLLPFASLPVATLTLYKVTGSAWDFKNLQFGSIEEIKINASDLTKARLSDLATLPSLRTLKLDLSTLPSAPEFREFESLAHLSLGSNDRLDSVTVETIPALETLSLGPNFSLKTVTLASLPALQSLDLSYTDIEVPDLSEMSSLVSLDMQQNVDMLSDPNQNLGKLPESLEVLNLQKNGLDSLEFVKRLTKLKALRISGNRITDLSPLADLPNLELLELDQNAITPSIETCPVAAAKSAVLANFCRKLLGL